MKSTLCLILLQLMVFTASAQTLQTETVQLELSYRTITKEFFNRRDAMIKMAYADDYEYCAQAGTNKDKRSSKKQFRCNEYPYGETTYGKAGSKEWNIWKKIADVPVKYKDEKTTRTLNLDLLMTRPQRNTTVKRTLLDYKGLVNLPTTQNWVGNWTVQFIPKDNNLYASVCTIMPGFQIDATTASGKYTILKKWYASVTVDFSLYPGNLVFDGIDICGLLKVTLDKNLKPKYEIVAIDQPRLINAKISKPRLNIKNGWADALFSIYRKFTGQTLDSLVTSVTKGEVPTQAEIDNGTWIKYIPQGLLKQKFADNFKGMVKEVSEGTSNDSANTLDVSNVLADQCARLSSQVPAGDLRVFAENYCRASVKKAQVEAKPFIAHAGSYAQKCYTDPLLLDFASDAYIDRVWWSMYHGQSWANTSETDYGCRLIGARITGQYRKEMAALVKCAAVEANVAINKVPHTYKENACNQETRMLLLAVLEDYLKEKYSLSGDLLAAVGKLKASFENQVRSSSFTRAKSFAENFMGLYKSTSSVSGAVATLESSLNSNELKALTQELTIRSGSVLQAHPQLAQLVEQQPELLATLALTQALKLQGVGL